MGKRDLASFLVILAFSASLAATAKPKDDDDRRANGRNGEAGFTTATADVDGGDAAVVAENKDAAVADATAVAKSELPDTSTWKSFAYAPGKLVGKTPPNMEVACTMAAATTMCVLLESKLKRTIAVFSPTGLEPKLSSDTLKTFPSTEVVYDDGNDVAVMTHKPLADSAATCDFVASSPAGLTAVTRTFVKGLSEAGYDIRASIASSECLAAIAFAHALQKSP